MLWQNAETDFIKCAFPQCGKCLGNPFTGLQIPHIGRCPKTKIRCSVLVCKMIAVCHTDGAMIFPAGLFGTKGACNRFIKTSADRIFVHAGKGWHKAYFIYATAVIKSGYANRLPLTPKHTFYCLFSKWISRLRPFQYQLKNVPSFHAHCSLHSAALQLLNPVLPPPCTTDNNAPSYPEADCGFPAQ